MCRGPTVPFEPRWAVEKFKTDIAKAFGNALRETRRAAGMSQEMLALVSGVDRTFVSMMERGIRQPALSTVFAVARALNVPPSSLIHRTEGIALPS